MSTHPNVLLCLALTPDGTSRKVRQALIAETQAMPEEVRLAALIGDDELLIAGQSYNVEVMESDYLDGYQISAKEGDIVVFRMMTYGYGETIGWDELVAEQAQLAAWADDVCSRHVCTSRIFVTANYW